MWESLKSRITALKSSSKTGGLALLGAMLGLMWTLELVDVVLGGHLNSYGIRPRNPDFLDNIFSAPFLHGDFSHLMANSVPFAVMGFMIALSGALRLLMISALIALISGLGVWLVAPAASVHIGASGVVFGFLTYLITRGFFNRQLVQVLLGLVVGAIYGSILLTGLVPQEGISWQGHLFGAIGGVVAAKVFKTRREKAEPESSPADPFAI